jgi:GT2 family glycosyltransferase
MTPGFPEDVGVAIVCYNNRETLGATLASLDAAACPRDRLLVVDGGAPTAPPTGCARPILTSRYPGSSTMPARTRGETPASAGRRSPYLFLMDADVRVRPDTIQRLRDAMGTDKTIGIGSPIVVHAADRHDPVCRRQPALHLRAISPWMNRPLAARGTARDRRRRRLGQRPARGS